MTLMMTTENLCMLIRIKKAMEEVTIEVEAEAVDETITEEEVEDVLMLDEMQ